MSTVRDRRIVLAVLVALIVAITVWQGLSGG